MGSNDAIVSTACLLIGVTAAQASRETTLMTGIAGLMAGAMSMAVGEFVSVSSQRDAEQTDIQREAYELATQPAAELRELAGIYVKRGLKPDLAKQVAEQLSAKDGLAAHLRDELGLELGHRARPLQAAWVSAASFAFFSLIPIGALLAAPSGWQLPCIAITTLVSLAGLGVLGAHWGGAPKLKAALRVTVGGALAIAVTAGIGRLL